ncbi:MAG: LacI family DNA-binding transcriptional regulator [Candidatus Omnitrophota bacterium]
MGAKTLEELAKKLDVSRRTLSRVLKSDRNVAEETRVRILKYLEREKYFPNIHAASLASKKVNTIGLIFPKNTFIDADFFAIDIINGVAKAASEGNYQLMIFTQDKFDSDQCLKLYRSRLVGGLIVVAILKDDIDHVSEVKRSQVPITLLCAYSKDVNSFGCDNIKGGYIATKYLIGKGKRKIAFIHGSKNSFDSEDRFNGYKKALSEAGIAVREEYVGYGNFNYDDGEVAMEKLSALEDPPDAVFAANDRMAIGVLKAIKKAGKRVPEDIAVIGFDNIPLCKHFDPPITTVMQPIKDIAYESTRALLDSIDLSHKKMAQIKLFEPKLIVRKSA